MSTIIESNASPKLTAKDFASNQDVKWCPGCGDYSILKQVQTVFPDFGIPKENIVFISGIGCAARFSYYMDVYGMHSIHGRPAVIAAGVKAQNPELSVWVVSGDGDAFSIGGNHFIHALRRNFNINYLVFNNQIYGLTKGQYSPTSEKGKIAKSTPFGSLEEPFNPASLALGARGSFIARAMDRDTKHLQAMLKRAEGHKGTSFLEIYQNCPVFNDGAFFTFTEKESKKEHALFLEHGKPLVFGDKEQYGIKLDGLKPVVVELGEGISVNDLWIHDEQDKIKAQILASFSDTLYNGMMMPRPFGVLYTEERPTYEEEMNLQIEEQVAKKGRPSLDRILSGDKTWSIL
jgi:2-oxoglutarate ferredoxin oxidoreductase subunit beta